MMVLDGKSVYKDICIGKIAVYNKKENIIKRYKVQNTSEEIARFETARIQVGAELDKMYNIALRDIGGADAAIFEVHRMILEDLDYVNSVEAIIADQQVNAEYAVGLISDNFAGMFEAMEDVYMRARASDMKDISERLLDALDGDRREQNILAEPSILLADDIAPSETIQLDKSKVLGFLMRKGSINSHTAILARSMGIPALMGVGDTLDDSFHGNLAIIDGFEGKVYIEPDKEFINKMLKKQEKNNIRKALLENLKGKEDVTLDGRKMKVYANIGNVNDLEKAIDNDAGGIGLFRSEFLYLENKNFPTEEQQFQIYKQAAEKMAGKPVVIRTMDIGADKQADYFKLDQEVNPALGFRAIRICLFKPEILKTQLRALYRAAFYGNISIMYPMIISVEEVRQIKKIEKQVKEELKKEGLPYKEEVPTGIMIETPAAALISDELAKEVDFFSVGTNDLTQYTLAIDRQNQKLDPFYNPYHKAIIKLIKMAADNIHAEGKWIGVCGELGADLSMTEEFIRMGIDELSVSPSMVLEVRNMIRSLDLK